MKPLDILKKEQARRMEELNRDIEDRERKIKDLDAKISRSAEYFKALDDSIGQLGESIQIALNSPRNVDTSHVDSAIETLRTELAEIRRNMIEVSAEKDRQVNALEEKLQQAYDKLELAKRDLKRSEDAKQKTELVNIELTQRESEFREQIKTYEETVSELKQTMDDLGQKYEEELASKEGLYFKISDLETELENTEIFEEHEPTFEERLEGSSYPWTDQIANLEASSERHHLHIRTIGTKGMIEESSENHAFNTAILLTSGNTRLLIDYGEENPGESFLHDLNPSAVLISHGHKDHVCRELELLECPIWMSKETDKILDPEKYDFKMRKIYPVDKFKIGDFEIEVFPALHSVKFPMTVFKISNGETSVGITTDIVGFHSGDKDKFFEDLDIWITDCSSLKKDLIRYDDKKGEPYGHLSLRNQVKWIQNFEQPPKVFLTHFGKESVEMSNAELKSELNEFPECKPAVCVDGSRMVFSEGKPIAVHGDVSVVNLFSELDEFAKKAEKKLSAKQLSELRSLHTELKDAKERLKLLKKKPPISKADIEKEIGYIQDAMVDILKGAGVDRAITDKYIYSLRKVPTHFKVISENKVISELKKRKLSRFIIKTESIDMSELRSYLVDHDTVLPGLRKIDSDVSIYVYERHEETPQLVYILAPEIEDELVKKMFAEEHQEYKKMAIVGSREATEDMLKAARHQAQKALESGWGIVTGGARGIDLEAIKQATMNREYARKLTIYLPKTIDDQPATTWELIKKAKKMGAKVVENAGAKQISRVTGQRPETVSYAKAALERNKLIMKDADAVVAIQAGKSRGTQHAMSQALKRGLTVKHIDEGMEATLLKKIAKVLSKKPLGSMKGLIKGMGKITPGVASYKGRNSD